MSLESLVEGYKKVDQKVLKDYTQLAKKLHLDEGKRKYYVSLVLNIGGGEGLLPLYNSFGIAAGSAVEIGVRVIDFVYSIWGSMGVIKEDKEARSSVMDYRAHMCRTYNSYVRLPTLATGLGCVGAYVAQAMSDPGDTDLLRIGLGLMMVSSSMYLKEIDPKLLQKQEEKLPWGATQKPTWS